MIGNRRRSDSEGAATCAEAVAFSLPLPPVELGQLTFNFCADSGDGVALPLPLSAVGGCAGAGDGTALGCSLYAYLDKRQCTFAFQTYNR